MTKVSEPTVLHMLEHHAKDKSDVALMILAVFGTMLRKHGWDIKNIRRNWKNRGEGPQSYVIFKDDKAWYFTDGGTGCIIARDDYHWKKAKNRYQLRTRSDVFKWARYLLA